jgi:hypothetical protein
VPSRTVTGSVESLTLPGRVATKDVDAVFHQDAAWLRQAVAELAEEKGWPPNWLNDGVKFHTFCQRGPASRAL